ncbi:hypothetical protein K443DRAFT_673856 [Laccaria amethystina LaAM-08-1]|uniref:Unplaced genomic scaffold K443scaffold_15, whole genome shotgun sequence n=1 Tax=Laccaria amethystina LaAM-08-1 TaxID=1095629 RepID=A0A0C9YFZ9_9AGAR|nr:hypothetical protein K443DRAFT_673856 [Laccaria amethystina LaAM-08-1]
MHLTPDNPLHYLAWPPHDDDLLDHLDISEHSSSFSVRYSADNQHIIAHARVTPQSSHHPGIRLIFLWDAEQSSWQYHNLAPMPFPKDSHSALRDAVAIHQSSCDFLPDPPNVVVDSHDNDDSYWNSYSQTGDGPPPALDSKPDHHLNSEDAYWAQYATVQGSGDSTLPSPLPNKQTFVQQDVGTNRRVIIAGTELQQNAAELYDPLNPPSPNSLSRRLALVSSRPDSPPLLDDSPSSNSDTPSTGVEITPNPSASKPVQTVTVELQEALRDSIKGIYGLWFAGQQGKNTDEARDLFLTLVRQALDGSSAN